MTQHSSTGTAEPLAKIRHRGVFVERQGSNGVYRYICHTGISKFLPDLYDTQAAAVEAIDAKFAAARTQQAPTQADIMSDMRSCWGLITDGMSKEDFFAASAVMIQDRLRRPAQQMPPSVSQHIGWLKQYVEGMTADNWQDMRLRAERQLAELSRALALPSTSSGTEPSAPAPESSR